MIIGLKKMIMNFPKFLLVIKVNYSALVSLLALKS